MNAMRWSAIALIVLGVLSLVYGSFTYTKDRHEAQIGPIEISVQDEETINIPIWIGVGAIAAGGMLLIFQSKR